jgi:hypothetical protein
MNYLATDGKTKFVIFDDGLLEVFLLSPAMDSNGGMDFAWRSIARFQLLDSSLPVSEFCPDAAVAVRRR